MGDIKQASNAPSSTSNLDYADYYNLSTRFHPDPCQFVGRPTGKIWNEGAQSS